MNTIRSKSFRLIAVGVFGAVLCLGNVALAAEPNSAALGRPSKTIDKQLTRLVTLNIVNSLGAALEGKEGPYQKLSPIQKKMFLEMYSGYWATVLPLQIRATKLQHVSTTEYVYEIARYSTTESDHELFVVGVASLLGQLRAAEFLNYYKDVLAAETREWGTRATTIVVKRNEAEVVISERYSTPVGTPDDIITSLRIMPGTENATRYALLDFPTT